MKPFPAVLRQRNRYILLRMHGGPFDPAQTRQAVSMAVLSFLGEFGTAQANFSVVKLKENAVVVRTTPDQLYPVIAALTLLNRVGQRKAWCEVRKVSGTLKGVHL